MISAIRAELAKQTTTRMWWVMVLMLFAYVAFTSGVLAFVLAAAATGRLEDTATPALPPDGLAKLLYSTGTAVGYVFPLMIGSLMVTSEFRHQTLTPTFLATPRRGRVLVAKVVVGAALGIVYGLVSVLASVLPSAGVLAAMDLSTELDSSGIWAMVARMVLANVLWVVIGIGVGTLVRSQVAAIAGVIVFTQFVEPVVRLVATYVKGADIVAQYLPGASSDALVGASLYTQMTGAGTSTHTLSWWAGAAMMLTYAVVLLVLGWRSSWRRDIT